MVKKVVIACDSFKGCLSSYEVAAAVEKGVRQVLPSCNIVTIPAADGGEGTSEILTAALGGTMQQITISDPLGRPVNARYGIAQTNGCSTNARYGIAQTNGCSTNARYGIAQTNGCSTNARYGIAQTKTAIIEMAQASGLTLLTKAERNPLLTSTYGTGEMILDAIAKGCRNFLIGIGGSATNDGGTGMLEALGVRFIDTQGKAVEGCCGMKLQEIASIDDTRINDSIRESTFTIACDVNSPFCGEDGATMVFAEQKGADKRGMDILEKGMKNLCGIIERQYGIDLSIIPGAGAAGGLGGGFKALLGAELKGGTELVLDTLGFDEIIKEADLVITGEGRIDGQSKRGKLISGVADRCRRVGVPVIAIGGKVDLEDGDSEDSCNILQQFTKVYAIGPKPQNESDLEDAMRPEVAYSNISKTVTKALEELSPSLCRENPLLKS